MTKHFGGVQAAGSIDAPIDGQIAKQEADGHCIWAVETKVAGELVGICGLRLGGHAGTPVDGLYELGWRIAENHWGQGIAREAAEAGRDWGWTPRPANLIAARTNQANAPSWGLMKRIGMDRRPQLAFRHPRHLDNSDPIGDMVVYAIERP